MFVDCTGTPPPENCVLYGAKFYTDYLIGYLFYTRDFLVVEIRGHEVKEKHKELWVGKHIREVRDDIQTKLYKTYIHKDGWAENQEVQRYLVKKNEYERALRDRLYWKNYYEAKGVLDFEQKAQVKELDEQIPRLKQNLLNILHSLNNLRSADFGDTDVQEYFKADLVVSK